MTPLEHVCPSNEPRSTRSPIAMGSAEYWDVVGWLTLEAEALDSNDLQTWLALLDRNLEYTMPVRQTVRRDQGLGISDEFAFFDESFASIEVRVRRLLESRTAWAEDPPSRTRRFVSNIRCSRVDGAVTASSYLLMLRSQGSSTTFDLLSAARYDRFTRIEGELRLACRRIIVDQATLGTPNLALFL